MQVDGNPGAECTAHDAAEAGTAGAGGAAAEAAAVGEEWGSWLSMLAPVESGDGWGRGGAVPKAVMPLSVAPVWEPVEGAGATKASSYDACFQGF